MGIVSGVLAREAAKKQANALREAKGDVDELVSQFRGDISGLSDDQLGRLSHAFGESGSALQGGFGGAFGAIGESQDALRGRFGTDSQLKRLAGGFGDAQGTLGGQVQGFDAAGFDPALSAQADLSNFQGDPGFEFRRQSGEDAINRAASASGGRLSGRTLKALGDFNQNLASQEFGNFANRQLAQRQQNLGLAVNQAGRQDAAGQFGQGLEQSRLSQLAGLQSQGALAGAGIAGQGLQQQLGLLSDQGNLSVAQGGALANLSQQNAINQNAVSQNFGSQLQGLLGLDAQNQFAAAGAAGLPQMASANAIQGSVNTLLGAAGSLGGIALGNSLGGGEQK